jgi:hypothetical protein
VKVPSAEIKGTSFEHVRFSFVHITPEMAAEWLKRNHKNRTLRQSNIDGYILDIKNGAWMTTHQGIAFDADGNLIDGQHRLTAIASARTPVLMVVSTGWTAASGKRKTMDAVDRGVARTLADQLHLQHGIDKRDAGTVVKICNAIASACFNLDRVRKSTTDTILGVFAQYQAEMKWILENPITELGIKHSHVQAALVMARAVWADKTADALARLRTGADLAQGNALLPLRNWLLGNGRREENAVIRQTVLHHLAAFVDGKNTPQLVCVSNQAYIRMAKLHRVRIVKICALYAQPLPDFLAAPDESLKPVSAMKPLSPEAIAIGKTLSPVFSSTDLVARTDENVGNWLNVWLQAGWTDTVGTREYRKTDKFGTDKSGKPIS